MSRKGARAAAALAALLGCSPDRQAFTPAPAGAAVSRSIRLDHFGYRPADAKVVVFTADPGEVVETRTADGRAVTHVRASPGPGFARTRDAATGNPVWRVDLGPLPAGGPYHVWSAALGARSYDFVVDEDVYVAVLKAALQTFYLQRCGVPKSAAHASVWADEQACHRADASAGPAPGQKDRGRLDLAGGWHDAGDYNKYAWYAVSNAVLFLLSAYESRPGLFRDGGLSVPESGNGVPDLLDEVRWELDFLLKLQLPDGAVLSRLHAPGSENGQAPPGADRTLRYYHDETIDAAAVFTGSLARAARVWRADGRSEYATQLERAAARSWAWLRAHGEAPEKAWAAAEVFLMDPATPGARDDLDRRDWSRAVLTAGQYQTHAALAYAGAPGATASVVATIRSRIAAHVAEILAQGGSYGSGMPDRSYHWGSNSARAAYGVFLLDAARLGATGAHSPAECRARALGLLHHFHGLNPMGMVYLTNMAAFGGEHSSFQIFHHWFGQSGSAFSRERYVGKPASLAEPHYPYFAGTDNHGIRDGKTSRFGPAPGFVPGGPNRDYGGDATPPAGARHGELFYRDWNDQSVWTARSWEITESSIGYQGPYVALVAAFAGRD